MLRPGGRAVVSAMHPAMFLKGVQARFTDPETGEKVQPGSFAHSIGDFVMAAVRAGFAARGGRRARPRRRLRRALPAGGEVRRLADARRAAALDSGGCGVAGVIPESEAPRGRCHRASASRSTRASKARWMARVPGPTPPSPTGRPSIRTTGRTSRETLVMKASSTRGSSSRTHGAPLDRHQALGHLEHERARDADQHALLLGPQRAVERRRRSCSRGPRGAPRLPPTSSPSSTPAGSRP